MALNNLTSYHRPSIIAAWVDQDIGCNDRHSSIKQRFTSISSLIEQWHFFEEPERFYQFLDDNPKTHIFLIMSGRAAQTIVPAKYIYENIHCMYVFCACVNNHRGLKNMSDKVKDVMNLEDDLYRRIIDDLSLLLIDIGESYVQSEDAGLARNYLEEALRLMHHTLHFKNDHGRIRKVNDLLERLDTWKAL